MSVHTDSGSALQNAHISSSDAQGCLECRWLAGSGWGPLLIPDRTGSRIIRIPPPPSVNVEQRAEGPTLMPQSGYLGSPEASIGLFDEEGYYRTGDAVRFADQENPASELIFAGRLSEDFKLASGTYVQVEALRQSLLNTCGDFLSEAVICGLDQNFPTALVWLKGAERGAARVGLAKLLPAYNIQQRGSARQIGAIFIQDSPTSFDAGEVTVKGNVAQRVVRERRAGDIAVMYDGVPHPSVLYFGLDGQASGRKND